MNRLKLAAAWAYRWVRRAAVFAAAAGVALQVFYPPARPRAVQDAVAAAQPAPAGDRDPREDYRKAIAGYQAVIGDLLDERDAYRQQLVDHGIRPLPPRKAGVK